MADHTFHFELVSPDKLVVSKAVAMVTVPGSEGEYGVLVGHAPMITTLQAGVIDVYNDVNAPVSERIFVAEGFAEVTQTRCTILATDAVRVSELNRAKLEEELRILLEQMANMVESERIGLTKQQAVITAKLQAAA